MLFETYLTNEDIKALSTGKMYDRFDGEYFETKKNGPSGISRNIDGDSDGGSEGEKTRKT